ncbi:hypothetical protein Tco_1269109 [Tanacetum coccineum]
MIIQSSRQNPKKTKSMRKSDSRGDDDSSDIEFTDGSEDEFETRRYLPLIAAQRVIQLESQSELNSPAVANTYHGISCPNIKFQIQHLVWKNIYTTTMCVVSMIRLHVQFPTKSGMATFKSDCPGEYVELAAVDNMMIKEIQWEVGIMKGKKNLSSMKSILISL